MLGLTRNQWVCTALLFIVFYLLNSNMLWKAMYPISYADEVQKASQHFGVDPFLVLAIMQIESKFEHDQLSKKGAYGLMQLMPDTAEWANRKSGVEEKFDQYREDPEHNILLGTWYISYLMEKYKNDHVKAIAAYNAGEGRVDRWLESKVWDGQEEKIEQIPIGETRHYVSRVLYYYKRFKEIYQADF